MTGNKQKSVEGTSSKEKQDDPNLLDQAKSEAVGMAKEEAVGYLKSGAKAAVVAGTSAAIAATGGLALAVVVPVMVGGAIAYYGYKYYKRKKAEKQERELEQANRIHVMGIPSEFVAELSRPLDEKRPLKEFAQTIDPNSIEPTKGNLGKYLQEKLDGYCKAKGHLGGADLARSEFEVIPVNGEPIVAFDIKKGKELEYGALAKVPHVGVTEIKCRAEQSLTIADIRNQYDGPKESVFTLDRKATFHFASPDQFNLIEREAGDYSTSGSARSH